MRTILDVADNTGARKASMIGVIGRQNRRYADVGDIITCNIKEAAPDGIVKEHEVVKAVLVRSAFPMTRPRRDAVEVRPQRGRDHRPSDEPEGDEDIRPGRQGAASLRPFLIASETSLALPKPRPTVPFPSPATTRALKEKRLPPLTTLATLFILTTFSTSPSSWPGRRCPKPRPPPPGPLRGPLLPLGAKSLAAAGFASVPPSPCGLRRAGAPCVGATSCAGT